MIGNFTSYQPFRGRQNSQYSLQIPKNTKNSPVKFGKSHTVEEDLDKLSNSDDIQRIIKAFESQNTPNSQNPAKNIEAGIKAAQKLFTLSRLLYQETFAQLDKAMSIANKSKNIPPEVIAKLAENTLYMGNVIIGTKDSLKRLKAEIESNAVDETLFLLSQEPISDTAN